MNVATRIAQAMTLLGVRHAYGLPGEDHMTLLDALDRAGIAYHLAYNESAAVIMAATDASLSGRPAPVILSLAPGLSNGMNGLLHAYLEELPVIVLCGQHAARRRDLIVRQAFDTEGMARTATKWTARVAPGVDPATVLCKAFDIAMTAPRGPVFLELPDEVATAPVGDTADDRATALLAGGQAAAPPRPLPEHAVAALADRLAGAERPVVLIGGRTPVATGTAARLASVLPAATLVTPARLGTLTADHPFFAGTFLNSNVDKPLLDRADVILGVNLRAFDFYNTGWSYPAPTLSLSDEPLTDWFVPFAERLTGDVNATLSALVGRLDGRFDGRLDGRFEGRFEGRRPASAWSAQEVATHRVSLRSALTATSPDTGLSVATAVRTVLSICDSGTVVAADAGFSKPLVVLLADRLGPDRFLASNALSTMGFAIPAALAAAATTDSPVVAFMGDGSLLMRAGELYALGGGGKPVLCVAFIDGSLSQISIKQRRRRLTAVGAALPPISCAALGTAAGITGLDVSTVDEVGAAVDRWRADRRPTLLGVHVDPSTSLETFELLRG